MTPDNLEKIKKLANDQLQDGVWVWFSADGSDRLFDLHLTDKYSSPTYALIYPGSIQLLISTLDADIDFGIKAEVYSNPETLTQILSDQFCMVV